MNSPTPELRPANPLDAWVAGRLGLVDEPLDREHIIARQMARFSETLAWAKTHSPYYRSRLGGIDPATLTLPADLRRLPFTTAEDLRRNDPPLLCVSQNEISRVVTLDTSGTSGPPKRLFFTADDLEAITDFFHHGMSVFTRPGDRVAILFPGERPGSIGELLAIGLRRLGAEPIAVGWPVDPRATAGRLHREQPDVVAGVPVAMLAVARHGAAFGPLRVRSVLVSSDHASQSVRAGLAALWQCEVFDHYGMTEMGYGGGVECAAHSGYHVREQELLMEVVDVAGGQPVEPGQTGELVVSTLTRKAQPLIRYRTGDLASLLPGTCACGSPLLRIGRITARVDAGIDLAGGGLLTMPMLDEALFADPQVIDFTACHRPAAPANLHVDIVCLGEHADAARLRAAIAGVAPVAQALAADSLRLSITCHVDGRLRCGAGKRRITLDSAPS